MIKLIEISGDSCASCHALLPGLNAVANENGIALERIDIETSPEAIEKYGVERIPTIVLADGEKIIAKCSGFQPEEILSLWVEAKLEEYSKNKLTTVNISMLNRLTTVLQYINIYTIKQD